MSEQKEHAEGLKETTEKLWGATCKSFQSATSQANRYKKIVQCKIDLASLHKKIDSSHSDLGKMIDDTREAGEADVMGNAGVSAMLKKLDDLKHNAAQLEEDIETLKAGPPMEQAPLEAEAAMEEKKDEELH